MVDFAKTANLVFYIVKNYLLLNLSPPTVLVVELPNFNKSFLMVSPIQIVLRMTIEPLWSPWWTSPFPPSQVFYVLKSLFSPFRMTIYHMLSVRQVLWRVLLYTRPNLPQAEWLVMRGLLCWLIPMMDTCIFLIEACLLTSSYWFLCLLNLSTVWITAVTHLAE